MEDEDIAPNTVHIADPVGMGGKSCLYTILEYSVLAQLSAHTDWISSVYLALYPRLPFCVLYYVCIYNLLFYDP